MRECGILLRLSQKAGAPRERDGSLTIEQQENEVQAKKASADSRNSFEQCFGKTEHILKKVNRANQKARTDLLPVFTNRNEYNLLESLILAQDERWRRA